ncbi:MAG: mechanosensitive ion channel family protein [Rhodocyclaceae bacterium]|nr:mechanosensitive ion channel family protein [Rhodocyclaceae bacterium]MBX3670200.1 mechanosensitive ion channel family protein [Rhodocyclaceae bacterium]
MELIRELFNPDTLSESVLAMRTGGRVILILIAAWGLIRISHRLIRTFRIYVSSHSSSQDEVKRITTLGRVFRYIASVVISLVAGMLILSEFGISIAPILGAAGVVGIAIGFGAQSLVKDYFTGFFLLLEDQVHQGDVIEAGGKAGLVEEVTLRYIRLRDYSGNVHFVPNGLVTTVTNMSRGFAHSVMDIGVAYREDVDAALAVMRQVGQAMRASEEFGPRILDDIEMAGVEALADSSVTLRCRIKVQPLEQWGVRREYLRRVKQAFDAAGIEIPYPHLTVYAGQAKDGSAPPFPLRGFGATRTAAPATEGVSF